MSHSDLPSRRRFLFQAAASGAIASTLARQAAAGTQLLAPAAPANPLASYPFRNWERVYRDLYKSDSTFHFLCAPNDTHNCLLTAHVKNGVVTRIAPSYRYHEATDLEGNRATARWDPRCCQKGLALVRRFYGDRRCKRPMVRRGFKQWITDGMPRDPHTGAVDADKYLQRGKDAWEAVSWDEAFELSAKAMVNIARTYSGQTGQAYLRAQGYDDLMVDATRAVGTQVLKFRGGMPALGMTRVMGYYRLCNAMALLDSKIRGTGPDDALAGRGWDNYTWHTDLPPGHPQVTGQQTVDFDLSGVEHSKLLLVWGMNWITTKMPDSHWLTEARMKGTKVVIIACEYSATANKGDEVLIVRPGQTPALALGIAQVIVANRLYDEKAVKTFSDLPLLVRTDNGQMLRASDVFPGYKLADLSNNFTISAPGEKIPPAHQQAGPIATAAQRQRWGDHVVWDLKTSAPAAVNRDEVGRHFKAGLDPALEGAFDVKLADGKSVKCRPVFAAIKELLDSTYTPDKVSKLTWAPAEAIVSLAKQIAANPRRTMFAMGMGPNQFFNSDLKDRAVLLVAALTDNIGHLGGNVGSYAGNYRGAYLSGVTQWTAENPFAPELDPAKPAPVRQYFPTESVHYFNHGDTILRQGKAVLTGKTHMPTPTKSIIVANSNSLIGNAKGHYETVVNAFRRVEFVGISEWWWTASCEYADVVYPVDSWAELKYPDMTISVTNPFLYTFPATPLARIHDTRSDLEVAAGLSRAIGKLTDDDRHEAYWKFVADGDIRPHLQRILDHSAGGRGYRIEDLEAKAAQGIPAIMQTRTYPKYTGYEQTVESKPWYTKTGRLEFYREESEFMDAGENLPIHREPIDSTFFEPAVLVADAPHELLRPKQPADYGVDEKKLDGDARQARHVIRSIDALLKTEHPLMAGGHKFIFHTPKYRHGAHTTPVDVDIIAVWFGPFGDMHRRDKRTPFVSEMYIDIHPYDAKALGVEDGDYVHIDADPKDRPFHGWQKNPEWYKVARLLARARYYAGTPRGVTRMWHNAYGSTWGSVHGAATNPTGIAKNPATSYQSLFRTGSHQSCTRGYLKPTWMTDSLVVKKMLGQQMTQGFEPDVHCPTGAPREAMVKITRAEPGGLGGKGAWWPVELGLRPTHENDTLKKFIAGSFLHKA